MTKVKFKEAKVLSSEEAIKIDGFFLAKRKGENHIEPVRFVNGNCYTTTDCELILNM